MYGSTPSGQFKSYSYYLSHSKFDGHKLRIPVEVVDDKIPGWLSAITIDPEQVAPIQKIYKNEIKSVTSENKEVPLEQLRRQLQVLKAEETKLGRALITGKLSEEAYEELRIEWQEKILNLKWKIQEMEFDASKHLDDLDVALVLLQKIGTLFQRLDKKQKNTLLQLVVKQIIIKRNGEIISHDLHSPFLYLSTLITQISGKNKEGFRSESIHLGVFFFKINILKFLPQLFS